MAFLDTKTTTTKLGAGAVVLLIEGGIATALIIGLTATMTRIPPNILTTYQVPKELPPPTPPRPVDKTVKDRPSVIDKPRTTVELPPMPGTTTNAGDLTEAVGNDGNSAVAEVEFPVPIPTTTPPPLFKPRSAAPKGQWKQWVTSNDYPTSDLRAEHEGITRYRLSVDTGGRVSDCAVTTSSGWPGLDKAACDTIKRRAKFEPATDQAGARTGSSFSGSVNWQIPKE
jgi:periplasmic protein TonB